MFSERTNRNISEHTDRSYFVDVKQLEIDLCHISDETRMWPRWSLVLRGGMIARCRSPWKDGRACKVHGNVNFAGLAERAILMGHFNVLSGLGLPL